MTDRSRDRLFRGYGPLVGFAAVFLAVAVLVPSQQREVRVEAAASNAKGSALSTDDTVAAEVEGSTETAPGADGATGADPTGTAGTGGTAGGAGAHGRTGQGGAAAGANTGPAKVAGCGAAQVPGDPYSPRACSSPAPTAAPPHAA